MYRKTDISILSKTLIYDIQHQLMPHYIHIIPGTSYMPRSPMRRSHRDKNRPYQGTGGRTENEPRARLLLLLLHVRLMGVLSGSTQLGRRFWKKEKRLLGKMRRRLRSNRERRHKKEGGTYIMRDRRSQDPWHIGKKQYATVFLLGVFGPDYFCCMFPCNLCNQNRPRKKYNDKKKHDDETVIFTYRVSILHRRFETKTSYPGIILSILRIYQVYIYGIKNNSFEIEDLVVETRLC